MTKQLLINDYLVTWTDDEMTTFSKWDEEYEEYAELLNYPYSMSKREVRETLKALDEDEDYGD